MSVVARLIVIRMNGAVEDYIGQTAEQVMAEHPLRETGTDSDVLVEFWDNGTWRLFKSDNSNFLQLNEVQVPSLISCWKRILEQRIEP